MSYSDRQGLTEDCPLTKDKGRSWKFANCCNGSIKFVICSFVILTLAITTTLILQLVYTDVAPQGKSAVHGAVATDYTNCSQIGTKILRKGGNAVDAAVAATICIAVVAPHKTSFGGGGYILIYSHRERTEPLLIDFTHNTIKGSFATNGKRLPGLLRGLETAQSRYGNLPWRDIVEPSVKLAKEGFVVSKEFANEASKFPSENLYGQLNAGDILQIHNLADSLHLIAQNGTNVLYNGTLSQKIISTTIGQAEMLEQLATYEPDISVAKQSKFYGHTIYYPQHALSLKILLEALQKLVIPPGTSTVETEILVAQALIRSNIIPPQMMQHIEKERYSDVVAMDWQDKYVCVVTGLTTSLGLKYLTDAGFILDEADGENDLSAFHPIIFHNDETLCGLRGIFGTDDAILSSQFLYNLIVRTFNLSATIEYPRYYVLSDGIAIENNQQYTMNAQLRTKLSSIVPVSRTDASLILKSINGIIKFKDSMTSHSDSRSGGLASRF